MQNKIVDFTTHWVQSHHEKMIDERLAVLAEKGQQIRKDCLVVRVIHIALWIPYKDKDNNQESHIVVSAKVDYKQENGNAVGKNDKLIGDIGVCRLFFNLDGTLDHDEFEVE